MESSTTEISQITQSSVKADEVGMFMESHPGFLQPWFRQMIRTVNSMEQILGLVLIHAEAFLKVNLK
jgi:hypothetical protein